jgi:hypothetical protein
MGVHDMNYTQKKKRKILGRGKILIATSLIAISGFFIVFFAMWNVFAAYNVMLFATLPFFVAGIALWLVFGVYADKVSNKCKNINRTRTEKGSSFSGDVVKSENLTIVFHYTAKRNMYKTVA